MGRKIILVRQNLQLYLEGTCMYSPQFSEVEAFLIERPENAEKEKEQKQTYARIGERKPTAEITFSRYVIGRQWPS
jgi:hypothetical protein